MLRLGCIEERDKKMSLTICLAMRHFNVNDYKLPDGAEDFRADSEREMLRGMNSILGKLNQNNEIHEILPIQGKRCYY
jgi:predicted SpoU family rRNA methylase